MRDKFNSAFYEQICETVKSEQIHFDEPLDKHTTFRVGGPADYFIEVASAEEIAELLRYFYLIEKPFYVIGNGSNLLVSDKGYSGVILSLCKNMSGISLEGDQIRAGGGAMLSSVARLAAENSLKGLEFAAGIPGTMGGAVVMNAGAFGGEIAQVLKEIEAVTEDGSILHLTKDELELGYRTSLLKKRRMVCTEVILQLQPGNGEEILSRMEEIKAERRAKQPLEYPSAGSTFKRPEGYYAGKLIMDANLRGLQIGGARVSDKHCGFIINTGNATAADIKELMDEVTERVKLTQGVRLEPEVCMLGDF